MALTAGGVLSRLGSYVKQDKSQSDQARYLLPFVLLMRLDSKLKPTRSELLDISAQWDKAQLAADSNEVSLEAMEAREVTGQYFYNLGPYDLAGTKDKSDVLTRLRALLSGFSPRVRTVLADELKLLDKAADLHKNKALFGFVGELLAIQQEAAALDDDAFGRLLSDLLQLLSEGANDDASECATPRDVVDLMVALLPRSNPQAGGAVTVYDPTYGTAGLLVQAAARLHGRLGGANVAVSGHEKRGEMHAIGALTSLLLASTFNGQAPEDAGAVGGVVDLVKDNSLLPQARRPGSAHYAVCNPPQGKSGDWKDIKDTVLQEAGVEGSRFAVGTPAVGDASLLFVQHIIDRLKASGRAVMVLNGSPLFAGQVAAKGQNEQAIRSWLLERDYVDAIIGLPPNLHFNTDIPTYLWVLDKQRPKNRAGQVVLVNAAGRPGAPEEAQTCFATTQKNQNKKRFRLTVGGMEAIVAMVEAFEDVDRPGEDDVEVPVARVVPAEEFRFRVVKVHRPLRRRVTIDSDGLTRLFQQKAVTDFQLRDDFAWDKLYEALKGRQGYTSLDAGAFDDDLKAWAKAAGIKTPSPTVRKAILAALSERDPAAIPLRDSSGNLVADPDLDDEERIPWVEADEASDAIEAYLDAEVRPYVAPEDRDLVWADAPGLPGAEIPFNRIFYRYHPPRGLRSIGRELRETRREVDHLLDGLERDLEQIVPPSEGHGK